METDVRAAGATAALADIALVQGAAVRGRRTPLWMWHTQAAVGAALLSVMVVLPTAVGPLPGWVTWLTIGLSLVLQRWFDRRSPGTDFRRQDPRAKRLNRWYVVVALTALFAGAFIGRRLDQWWWAALAVAVYYGYTVWTGVASERGIDRPQRPVVS